jgi:hypothetical protein
LQTGGKSLIINGFSVSFGPKDKIDSTLVFH